MHFGQCMFYLLPVIFAGFLFFKKDFVVCYMYREKLAKRIHHNAFFFNEKYIIHQLHNTWFKFINIIKIYILIKQTRFEKKKTYLNDFQKFSYCNYTGLDCN